MGYSGVQRCFGSYLRWSLYEHGCQPISCLLKFSVAKHGWHWLVEQFSDSDIADSKSNISSDCDYVSSVPEHSCHHVLCLLKSSLPEQQHVQSWLCCCSQFSCFNKPTNLLHTLQNIYSGIIKPYLVSGNKPCFTIANSLPWIGRTLHKVGSTHPLFSTPSRLHSELF